MKILAILATTSALGFMAETCETILVTQKGVTGPVRVNVTDFDADQEKPTGERAYGKYSGKETEADTATPVAQTFAELGIPPQAAPSAPDFSGKQNTAPVDIDPDKLAAAPAMPSKNSRLVMQDGKTWYIINEMGQKLKSEDVGGEIAVEGYKSRALAEAAIAKLPH